MPIDLVRRAYDFKAAACCQPPPPRGYVLVCESTTTPSPGARPGRDGVRAETGSDGRRLSRLPHQAERALSVR